MSETSILEAAWTLNPRTMQRARRLAAAQDLLRAGKTLHESRMILRQRFSVAASEAWILVSMASDIVETEPKK